MRNVLTAFATLLAAALPAAAAPAIEAVVLKQGVGVGFGNAVTLAYRPVVLFKDGSYTTDAAGALREAPRIDGRWRREGVGFTLAGNDGKRASVPAKLRARAAPAGATLEGEYRSVGGIGSVLANVPTIATAKTLRFRRDGSMFAAQAAGANAGDVVAASRSGAAARYRLEGYTITLQHADGRSEQRLFYLFPDSDRVIGVGAATLSERR